MIAVESGDFINETCWVVSAMAMLRQLKETAPKSGSGVPKAAFGK
jgi:hypothetical protein